jgi:hypothetical protein
VYAFEVTKKRITVLRHARSHCPAGKPFHRDELTFKQRIEFLPLGNVVSRIPDQHQCRKFMSAEHSCLLIAWVGAVWITSAEALAFDVACRWHNRCNDAGVDGKGERSGAAIQGRPAYWADWGDAAPQQRRWHSEALIVNSGQTSPFSRCCGACDPRPLKLSQSGRH